MSTYVIGDVQGCFKTLMALVRELRFDASSDQLWFVGDLVNRGPDNANVLRWIISLGESAVAVLGNHDIHLLARAAGVRSAKPRDTLDDVLEAPDRDELVDWLRRRPTIWIEDGDLMVHAGLIPEWSVEDARVRGEDLCLALSGDNWRFVVTELTKPGVGEVLERTGPSDLRTTSAALQRIRTLDAEGRWVEFNGRPASAPTGARPWFDFPHRRGQTRVLFGHWAALGLLVRDDVVCLDTGCVWGRTLSAFDRETQRVVSVRNCEKL